MSAAQFDKELRNYASSGRYRYYALPAPAEVVKAEYSAKPITPLQSSAVIADIHLHSQDYREKAAEEYQEILKADPNNAAAARGLGYAYLQAKDFEKAAEYFKRAAQADSGDPRVHYYSALLMSREDGFSQSDVKQIRSELETAVALDPSFADAYSLLAFAQARSGDLQNALASAQKAVSLNPRNDGYQFNLAQMYLGNNQPDKAISILQSLSHSSNPAAAMRAAQSLQQAREFQAQMQAPQTLAVEDRQARDSLSHSAQQFEKTSRDANSMVTIPAQQNVKFVKGTIVNVDCSSSPAAMLTLITGGKTLQMRVPDTRHALLIGADEFSCTWNKQKVAINYRESGDLATVVSIEVQ